MDYIKRAEELRAETVAHRRYFHKNAEAGLDLPMARAYIMEKLAECGIIGCECGHGVTATVGERTEGGVILLRADMDALPMEEQSGEEFSSENMGTAHTCGHDFHAAMLLTAAKLLKENENNLRGQVKLMFQPGEEIFKGCADMIGGGILDDPKPDAALAFHVASGKKLPGMFMYNSKGTMMCSADGFRITVRGRGGHGAYPQMSVDPINMAVHIYTALQSLIARECDPWKTCILTVGKLSGGTAPNIIPDSAVLEGTIRSDDRGMRELLVRRMKEITAATAESFGGKAEIEMLSDVPPLICDGDLTEEMLGYIKEMNIPNAEYRNGMASGASEDFANIAERIPSAYFYMSAGFPDERGNYSAHNPKVRFNEDVCPIGAAAMACCTERWMEKR